MQFELERTTVLGRPALTVRGELDLATAPRLAEAVESLLSQQPQALVVDLTGTTFLDSSGARQLVRTARRAAAGGVALVVVCPRANLPVRLVVDLLELRAVVPIVETPGLLEGEVGPYGRPAMALPATPDPTRVDDAALRDCALRAAVVTGDDPGALLDGVLAALDPADTDDVTLLALGRT